MRGVSVGGIVMPLRMSRSRAPGDRHVDRDHEVSNPAFAARSTSAIDRSRSFHM